MSDEFILRPEKGVKGVKLTRWCAMLAGAIASEAFTGAVQVTSGRHAVTAL